MKKGSFVEKVAAITGADADDVMKSLDKMDIDTIMKGIDAVLENDEDKVREMFASEITEGFEADAADVEYIDMDRLRSLAGLMPDETRAPGRFETVEFEGPMTQEEIMSCCERILKSVEDLTVRDAKEVRTKIAEIQQRLFESAAGRKRV